MKKVIEFLKNWTLPCSIVSGAAIYYIFAMVPALDGVGRAMSPVFDQALPWFLFVILFVTFCKIDYSKMRPARWHLYTSLAQVVMVVVVVFSIIYFDLRGPHRVLMECVLTCIIGPCAAASAVVTAKLGGSLESMTTYTFMSNVLTAVMIPIAFPLLEHGASLPFWHMLWLILLKVCAVLVVPMGLAYGVRRWLPRLSGAIAGVPDLGFYLWGCSLSIVSGITMRNIMHAHTTATFLVATAVVSFVLCVIQFSVGRNIGRYLGASTEAGQGLGQKNTGFAIWVASAYLTPLATVGPGCYILWQNLVNSLELWQHRRMEKKYHD